MVKRILFAIFLTLLLLAISAQAAYAHGGQPHGIALWTRWSFDPLVLLGTLLTGLVYLRGWKTLELRGSPSAPARWKKYAFLSGLLILLLALVSPLDAMAEELFSAHMVQHTLLMLVAPPLMALGLPMPTLLLGLPRQAQTAVGRAWRSMPVLHRLWKSFTRPGAVWLITAAVLWGWHAPLFYTASVENDAVHALQHSSFILAALLFWWIVLHAYGAVPERRGAGVMYLFTTAMHSGLLGALITFSPTVWYPVYAGRAEAWGISALADQQLAGTIMWVPAGMIFLFAALALLKRMIDTVPTEEGIAPQKELK